MIYRNLTALCLLLTLTLGAWAQTPDYNITCGGQGKDGQYLVRVTATLKQKNVDAQRELKRLAVHGVLFRGFTGTAKGCTTQKPLAGNPDLEFTRADFFTPFLGDGGGHEKFVSLVTSSYSTTKLKKKMQEASALLLVDKEGLLRFLEQEKVIQGFSEFW